MSDAKVRGIVHLTEQTKTYGKNGFRKRLVVLEQDNGRYTNYVPLEFTNDNCDTVDGLNVGDEVEVEYRLSGRKWQKDPSSEVKFFLNAEATSYTVLGNKPAADEMAVNNDFAEAAHDDENDIPF